MRDSFIFYKSFYDALKELDDDTRLQCFDTICQYAVTEEEPDIHGVAKSIFSLIKPQIDANNKRYENGRRGGNKTSGSQNATKPEPNQNQSGTKPEPNANQTLTKEEPNPNQSGTKVEPNQNQSGTKPEPNVNVNENDNVNENGNENENEKNTPPSPPQGEIVSDPDEKKRKKQERERMIEKQASELFEVLWKLYPKMEGKGKVSITHKKDLLKIGQEEMTRCIERYKQAKQNTEYQYLMNGSTFFNSGYVDYLDKNYIHDTPPEEPKEESPPEMTDDEWVAHQKELIEQDKRIAKEKGMTMDEYYDWLEEENRKNRDGPDGGSRP